MTPSSLLGHAKIYVFFQRLVGAHLARRACIQALAPREGERIIDVGCGPAYYFPELPAVVYHGFDTDERYIDWARSRWGDRATFHCAAFSEEHLESLAPVDGVMLMGLLHHLDDTGADQLLSLVARALAPSGRAVTLDTVLFDGQSAVSRWLARNDRGDYVRAPERFEVLARAHFEQVESHLLGDTLRMPSAHLQMVLRVPKR